MSRYAVKIGEIHLHSKNPISEEERKRAIRRLLQDGSITFMEDGLEIAMVVTEAR